MPQKPFYHDSDHESARRRQKRWYKKHKRQAKHEDEKKELFAIRLSTQLIAIIDRIWRDAIALGKYPWRSRPEVVPALLKLGLSTLKDGDPVIDEEYTVLEAQELIARIARSRQTCTTLLNQMTREVQELQGINETRAAAQIYWSIYEKLSKMTDTVWKHNVLAEARKRFPEIHAKPAPSLRFLHFKSEKLDQPHKKTKRSNVRKFRGSS